MSRMMYRVYRGSVRYEICQKGSKKNNPLFPCCFYDNRDSFGLAGGLRASDDKDLRQQPGGHRRHRAVNDAALRVLSERNIDYNELANVQYNESGKSCRSRQTRQISI